MSGNWLALIPEKVRLWIYIVYAVGSVVATYLGSKGFIGGEEIALWTGLGALFGVTAASNVFRDERGKHEAD